MSFGAKLRDRIYGHYWYGEHLAKERELDSGKDTYVVHARCMRCGLYKRVTAEARPSGLPVVSSS